MFIAKEKYSGDAVFAKNVDSNNLKEYCCPICNSEVYFKKSLGTFAHKGNQGKTCPFKSDKFSKWKEAVEAYLGTVGSNKVIPSMKYATTVYDLNGDIVEFVPLVYHCYEAILIYDRFPTDFKERMETLKQYFSTIYIIINGRNNKYYKEVSNIMTADKTVHSVDLVSKVVPAGVKRIFDKYCADDVIDTAVHIYYDFGVMEEDCFGKHHSTLFGLVGYDNKAKTVKFEVNQFRYFKNIMLFGNSYINYSTFDSQYKDFEFDESTNRYIWNRS